MTRSTGALSEVIWATRGRDWGFRFLLDGGHREPLEPYSVAFAGREDEPEMCVRQAGRVALRFADPEGRRDRAGRVIPHEFVIHGPLAVDIESVEDGRQAIWPLVERAYASVWAKAVAPTAADLHYDNAPGPKGSEGVDS